MFACLEKRSFTVPDFVQASILIISIPQKWDQILTWLLSYYLLNKLEYGVVANAIIGEHQHLAGVSRPLQSANRIFMVKRKPNHPPSWKGKSKDEQPAASGTGSSNYSKEKKGQSCAEKKVKEHREAAKERQHSHMAEMAMVVNPPALKPLHQLYLLLRLPFWLSRPSTVMVGLSPPPPLSQKDFQQQLLPSLYLEGTPARRKQDPAYGLMLRRHAI